MLEQHGIDLKRRNLLSAAVDQFLESPSERQVILCIENSLVSRAKIPIRERAGVRVGVVAVPMHHVAPTDRDFSLLALGKDVSLLVENGDFDSRAAADRAGLSR